MEGRVAGPLKLALQFDDRSGSRAALAATSSLCAVTPIAAAAHQQFLAAAAAGFGSWMTPAVVRVYERLAGIEVAAAARSINVSDATVVIR